MESLATELGCSRRYLLARFREQVGLGPKTGFAAGPTYEANTLAGQTKAVFNNTLTATKSALHIKP